MFSLNLVLGTFVSRRFTKPLDDRDLVRVIQTNEIADTDDDDTDDSDLIYFGKSRCGTDIKIKIVGKCLMDKKKVVSLLNGYI